MAKKRKLNR